MSEIFEKLGHRILLCGAVAWLTAFGAGKRRLRKATVNYYKRLWLSRSGSGELSFSAPEDAGGKGDDRLEQVEDGVDRDPEKPKGK